MALDATAKDLAQDRAIADLAKRLDAVSDNLSRRIDRLTKQISEPRPTTSLFDIIVGWFK